MKYPITFFKQESFRSGTQIFMTFSYKIRADSVFHEQLNADLRKISSSARLNASPLLRCVTVHENMDRDIDPAFSFDTSWMWQRCGLLLGAELPDFSLTPGVSYHLAFSSSILSSQGQWFPNIESYLKWRIADVPSAASIEDKNEWIQLFVQLAEAGKVHTKFENMLDSMLSDLPTKRMRTAFKNSSVSLAQVPELAAYLKKCSVCGKCEEKTTKMKTCPCKAAL